VQVLVLEVSRKLGYGGAQKRGCVRVPYGSEHTTRVPAGHEQMDRRLLASNLQ